MNYKNLILIATITIAAALTLGLEKTNQQTITKANWLENWKKQNKTWQAMHLQTMAYDDIETLKNFINDILVPMKYNALILTVDYAYDFKSYSQLSHHKINKLQARNLTAFCRERGIRLIPMFNCIGHQSWLNENKPLLLKFPEFDETPHIKHDNKGIYCREWCPLHPKVNNVVFALIDEIIDAFDADAFHVGMDEIFLCGYPPLNKTPWKLHTAWKTQTKEKEEPFPKGPQCPRCKGKDPSEIIAKAINDYHKHIVKDKHIEMMIWGDRLLDGNKMPYGITEASKTGSHKAINQIPKDIIICDWHYGYKNSYPSINFFQEKGFRVIPSLWNNPTATYAFKQYAEENATNKMIGSLSCGWSASPKQLIQAVNKKYTGKINKDASGIIKSMKVVAGDTQQIEIAQKNIWLKKWKKKNKIAKAMHFSPLEAKKFDSLQKFITDVMVPKGLNALILEINYSFKFKSHPELAGNGFNKKQARQLTKLCRQNNIRLIPLFNCIGHQSDGGENTFSLLKKYPQFDETPYVPADNNGIYCREWCPSNPDVYPIIFDLIDEIIDAFQADAINVGMDEIFLLGDPNCPHCKGKNTAKIFANAINKIHQHIVNEKGIEMHMWGDRLLNADEHSYEGEKEVSKTGTHSAIDMIPKDIVICDWHYWWRPQFSSVKHFVDKGFRVWPTTWRQPSGAIAFWQAAKKCNSDKTIGIIFTGWYISSPDQLLDVINKNTEKYKGTEDEHRIPYAKGILETIDKTLSEINKSPN